MMFQRERKTFLLISFPSRAGAVLHLDILYPFSLPGAEKNEGGGRDMATRFSVRMLYVTMTR